MTGTSLIATMAAERGMDPVQFARTLRSTVMPSDHTDEQFAAFMLVAHKYGLDPVTREIYAYPGRKGGINPVLSIDGWIHLVNSHPQCDGFEITYNEDDAGKLVSATCTMWRHDRTHPVVVTEYFSETYRNTDPWNQMPRRMLRHKCFKEAARLAFGFSGIVDEDEARDMKPFPSQEKITDAHATDDLDAFIAATTFPDHPAGVHSPSAAAEQGGGEGLQQASATADPFDASPAMAPHTSGVGSDEPSATPRPSSLPPAERRALIESAMQLATRPGFETDERLSMLDELRAEAGKLSGLSADTIKDVVSTAAKVVRKELTPKAATKYLESAQ
jgi:phage recombination protein Bet